MDRLDLKETSDLTSVSTSTHSSSLMPLLLKTPCKETVMITRRRPTILIHCFCSLIAASTLFGCSIASTKAQQPTPDSEVVIPLEGLDPVMLAQGKEVQGDM